MTRKTTLVAVVAVVVVGTTAALAVGASPHATSATDTLNQETTTQQAGADQTTQGADANVTFLDQSSNGTTVVVDEAVLPDGGFVVIHAAEEAAGEDGTVTAGETTTDGEAGDVTSIAEERGTTVVDGATADRYEAGEVLGNSSFLDVGAHLNVTVRLDQPLEEDQVLVAMAHQDTNDNRLYEFPDADGPYVRNGDPVVDAAQVTVDGTSNATATGTETETTTEA